MNTDKIPVYIWIGMNDLNWYADCKQLFIRHFGIEQLTLVTKLFAATSINSSLRSNITLFRKALYEIQHDKPFSNYLPVMLTNLEYVREGKELSGRKIKSFASAMAGDPDAVVVDIWLLRAFGFLTKGAERSRGASNKEYTLIENYCRTLAKEMGINACQISSMIWAGIRIKTNGDKDTHYKKHLDYHLTNLFGCI